MKKFLLLGTVLATSLLSANAQSSYGLQIGTTYYDLPSNASVPNRVVYNEDDKSVSVTWTQSITALAQPSFERGAGYNHFRPGFGWLHGNEGECRINNGCNKEYSGWPELINFPKEDVIENGVTYKDVSKEIIIAHSGGLKETTRFYRGDSAWRPTKKLLFDKDYCADANVAFWPRVVSEGNDYVHMIATYQDENLTGGTESPCNPYSSVSAPHLYSRSSDQGQTWDIKNLVLPNMKDQSLFTSGGGDSYAIAANGKYVAIVAGGKGESWVMWKSEDRGLTWKTNVIRAWDPKVYDQEAFFTGGDHARASSDDHHAVVIDNDGTVHCFTGVMTIAIDATTGEYGGFSTFGNSGIWYWNDKFEDFCEPSYIAEVVDYVNAAGTPHPSGPKYFGDAGYDAFDGMAQMTGDAGYYGSSTTMPNAAVDANGNIYVVYSSDVEGTSTVSGATGLQTGIAFRDIFMVWSEDGGKTWSKEINIAGLKGADDGSGGTSIEEDTYPAVAHKIGSDNILHVVFNMDYKPGSDVRLDNGEFSQQYQTYVDIDVTTLTFSTRTVPTVVTATPNTIASIADSANLTGDVFDFDVADGFYSTLSPMVVYNDTIIDTNACASCTTFYLKPAVECIDSVGANCGTFSYPDTTTICIGCAINGYDSISIIDTFFYKLDTIITDLNADGDSLYKLSFDESERYTVTAVYGNACPNPSTSFTLTNLGGAITAKVLGGMDTIETCSGEPVTLSGLGGGGTGTFTYMWDGVTSANGTTTISPTASKMYVFDVNGGAAKDSIYVMVNTISNVLDAGADQTLTITKDDCQPVANLGSADTSGNSYSWTPIVGMSADDALTSDPVVLPNKTTTYYVTTTNNANGCSAVDSVTITVTGECRPASVKEAVINFTVSVFPNPATDVVNVEVGYATINNITVYNNLGAVVEVINANNTTIKSINTSNYNKGIYYLYIQTTEGEVTKQFTIVE